MNLSGCRALVTGANRGIGRGFVEGLLGRGASSVFAGVRDLSMEVPSGSVPVLLDVTDGGQVQAAADVAGTVDLLINNAGVSLDQSFLGPSTVDAARLEMDVNYFGTLAMCRAFAPVLARNGGGAVVNVLSVASWFAPRGMGSYAASKSAGWALTNGLRVELAGQGTAVMGVYCGYVDTDMTAGAVVDKLSVVEVVGAVLDGVEAGLPEVLVGERARSIKVSLPRDLELLYGD